MRFGPVLVAAAAALVAGGSAGPTHGVGTQPSRGVGTHALRPAEGTASAAARPPDTFPLFPAPGHAPASGTVRLRQAWSPFGVTVTPEGTVAYEVAIETRGLPPAPAGEAYVAWVAAPDLSRIRRLGPLGPDGTLEDRQVGDAFLVVVSREPGSGATKGGEAAEGGAGAAPGPGGATEGGAQAPGAGGPARWRGPVVLRGSSPGSRIMPLFGHSIFQQSPM